MTSEGPGRQRSKRLRLAAFVVGLPALLYATAAGGEDKPFEGLDAAARKAEARVLISRGGDPVPVSSEAARYVLEEKAGLDPTDPDEADPRIFGGRPAEPGARPWQVALLAADKLDGTVEGRFKSQFCGGSLIARQWVLTAAHCIFSKDGVSKPESVAVLTGTNKLSQGGDIRAVARVIPFEDYDPITLDNDVALLQLAEPIQNSAGPVGAVALPSADAGISGSAVVSGWGKLDDGKFPDDLMETDLDLIATEVCNKGLMDLYARELAEVLSAMGGRLQVEDEGLQQAFQIILNSASEPVKDTMMCAGTASGERDSCSGDSGGPLVVRQEDGSYSQVGIVSWGQGPLNAETPCGHPQLFGVYARASKYYDWIAGHVVGGQ